MSVHVCFIGSDMEVVNDDHNRTHYNRLIGNREPIGEGRIACIPITVVDSTGYKDVSHVRRKNELRVA